MTGYVTFAVGTNAASDAKLKDQVQDFPEQAALDLLKTVKTKTYVRNDLPVQKRRCWFLAQAVQAAADASLLGENLVGETTRGTGSTGASSGKIVSQLTS